MRRWSIAALLVPGVAAAQPTEKQALPHAAARPDPYDQLTPTLVAGDGGYLAVWIGERGGGITDRIGAMRLDATGAPLDAVAFDLGPRVRPIDGDDRVAAAWDGSGYTVVWVSGVGNVEARRVRADGTLGPVMVVSPQVTNVEQRAPVIACGDGRCMAAWTRFDSAVGTSVRLARLADDAVLATLLSVGGGPAAQYEPAIAWNGTDYLVTWRDLRNASGGDLFAARVTVGGTVLDPAGIDVAGDAAAIEEQPAVTWSDSAWQVVWRDIRNGAVTLRTARVSASGTVTPVGGLHVADGPITDPAIAWNGVEHLVTWTDGGIRAIRLDAVGNPLASASAPWGVATRATVAPRAAAQGFLVAWRGWRSSDAVDTDALLATVSTGASSAGPASWISGTASSESEPALGSDGNGFLAAWTDRRDGWPVIRAARLDLDGQSLDGSGAILSAPGITADEVTIVGGSGQYLVMWARRAIGQTTERLEAIRVGSDGVPLDAAPITVSPAYPFEHRASPSAVWNGSTFLIVWASADARIVGARVSPDGQLLDAMPFTISRSSPFPEAPSLAWNGSLHLVVWRPSNDAEDHHVVGARLDVAGARLDPDDLAIADDAAQPAVAGGPRGFLVTWSGVGNAPITRGQLFDRNGAPVGSPFPEDPFIRATSIATTRVVWDGASWLYVLANPDNSGRTTFSTTRIRHDGAAILETAELGVSTSYGRVAVASTGSGRAVFIFPERVFSPYLLLDNDHLWSRTWRSDLTLPPETSDGGTDPGTSPAGCCQGSEGESTFALALLLLPALARRRRRISRLS